MLQLIWVCPADCRRRYCFYCIDRLCATLTAVVYVTVIVVVAVDASGVLFDFQNF